MFITPRPRLGLSNRPTHTVTATTPLHPITHSFITRQMTIGRDLLACASQGDYTLFAGGSAPQVNQSETAEVDIWNHVTGAWTTGKLSQPR